MNVRTIIGATFIVVSGQAYADSDKFYYNAANSIRTGVPFVSAQEIHQLVELQNQAIREDQTRIKGSAASCTANTTPKNAPVATVAPAPKRSADKALGGVDDEELIRRINGGDRAALEEVMNRRRAAIAASMGNQTGFPAALAPMGNSGGVLGRAIAASMGASLAVANNQAEVAKCLNEATEERDTRPEHLKQHWPALVYAADIVLRRGLPPSIGRRKELDPGIITSVGITEENKSIVIVVDGKGPFADRVQPISTVSFSAEATQESRAAGKVAAPLPQGQAAGNKSVAEDLSQQIAPHAGPQSNAKYEVDFATSAHSVNWTPELEELLKEATWRINDRNSAQRFAHYPDLKIPPQDVEKINALPPADQARLVGRMVYLFRANMLNDSPQMAKGVAKLVNQFPIAKEINFKWVEPDDVRLLITQNNTYKTAGVRRSGDLGQFLKSAVQYPDQHSYGAGGVNSPQDRYYNHACAGLSPANMAVFYASLSSDQTQGGPAR